MYGGGGGSNMKSNFIAKSPKYLSFLINIGRRGKNPFHQYFLGLDDRYIIKDIIP